MAANIYKKIGIVSMFSLAVILSYANIASAQNVQNFLTNEESKIQQDMGTGAINSNQASAIQDRQAKIMYQEQQDMSQNGGSLNPQQQRQIAGEESNLNSNLNRDADQSNSSSYRNNQMAYQNYQNNNFNNRWQNWPNSQPQQNWQNFWNQNQTNNFNNQSATYNNGYDRHHRRQW